MKNILKFSLLATVIIPLLYSNSVFFEYSSFKILFFRLFTAVTSILFLVYFFYKKSFRQEATQKAANLIRHPLFISIFVFILVSILSSALAVDTYSAFWGDIQRGEGLVGIIYYFSIFILSFLVFERKNWLWFFKLTLFISTILLVKEFSSFFGGMERPGSFIGNPTFLAGYLIFSIFSSILVLSEEKSKFWKYLSALVLILAVPGIFITETRGAILGVVLGFAGILFYFAFKGKTITYKNFNTQKASIVILCFLVIFSGIFFTTKKNDFWQKVPGLARVATISSEDISTRTRLFSIKTSIESVDPAKNGWKKALIGWGPNNYILAFGKYYNIEQYKYEREWFDRAHNKILDVLVMNGAIGLLIYLILWFFLFKYILHRNDFSLETVGFIFMGTSFFVHLLFVFDHISTSVPFFIVLAFIIYLSLGDKQEKQPEQVPAKKEFYLGSVFVILTLFVCYVFVRGDVLAYMQMKKYLSFKRTNEGKVLVSNVDSMFEPFTIAQSIIRREILLTYFTNLSLSDEKANSLFNKSLEKAEAYINKMPNDFRFMASIAGVYSMKGHEISSSLLLEKGKEYFDKALTFSPNRPDFLYGLALNLAFQKKYSESYEILEKIIKTDPDIADSYYYFAFILSLEGERNYEKALGYFEKAFDMKPDLFAKDDRELKNVYSNFVKYFYEVRNKENFIRSAKRLKENDQARSAALGLMLDSVEGKGVWPNIEFK